MLHWFRSIYINSWTTCNRTVFFGGITNLCPLEFIMTSSQQDLLWGTFSRFVTLSVFLISSQALIHMLWWINKFTPIILHLQISGSFGHLSRGMAGYFYSGLAYCSGIDTTWISSMPIGGKTSDTISSSLSWFLACWCKSHFYGHIFFFVNFRLD